ncbi:MAG: type II secretion system F family protein [Porticoccaceae bacterium]
MATVAQPQVYIYKGKSREGKAIKGEVTGGNPTFIKAQLRKQGINATSIKKKPKNIFGEKAIKPAHIAIFTRQMATMMKAGVPLVQSFEIVADGEENPTLKTLINLLHNDVSSGTSFGASLRKHPKYFDDLFCSLVDTGEQSGALDTMLDRVATYKEKTEQLKAKIKKALTYPIAVVVVAVVVTCILLIKVVPVFNATYQGFGAQLPAFTLFLISISDFVINWWFRALLGVAAAIYAFKQAHSRSEAVRRFMDRFMLKVPIIGSLLKEAVVARFARTLATTFAAGVPLIEALESVAGAAGNSVYTDIILRVRDDVSTGIAMHTALRSAEVFPAMLLQLASIGEEAGALDEMMSKAADHYEESVDNAVDNLTALLEPMIMAVLGVVVGGLLIGMYMPIFNLGQVV